MTAKELLDKHMEFTIKRVPHILGEVFQAFIICEAQAKNGKWCRAWAVYNKVIEDRELKVSDRGILAEEFKALARYELTNFMVKRTGLKGYRGYFKFQDFRPYSI